MTSSPSTTVAGMAKRLARLEEEAARSLQAPAEAERERALKQAARALFDALEAIFPDDPWQPGQPRRTCIAKIDDLAERLQAGQLTDEDRRALAALPAVLPAEVLDVFGITVEGAVLTAGGLAGGLACAASRRASTA